MRLNRLSIRPVLVLVFSCLTMGMSFLSQATEKKVETLDEVTIIGNTELPSVVFDQPWQLASIEKTADKSPPKDIPGVMVPLEPYRYRQQLHFSQFLEIDVAPFQAR